MSLDVFLIMKKPVWVFDSNITHNWNEMAEAAGIYRHLWRPEEIGVNKAFELIEPLETALKDMKERPDFYKKYNSPNGWGKYENLVSFVEEYLRACKENPEAEVNVSR